MYLLTISGDKLYYYIFKQIRKIVDTCLFAQILHVSLFFGGFFFLIVPYT